MNFVFEYMNHVINEKFLVINKPIYVYSVGNDNSLANKYREDLFDSNVRLNNIL
jgi:hypothetical protein